MSLQYFVGSAVDGFGQPQKVRGSCHPEPRCSDSFVLSVLLDRSTGMGCRRRVDIVRDVSGLQCCVSLSRICRRLQGCRA